MSDPKPQMRRTRPAGSHGSSGFTLLEVLIAVAILAISLTSLLTSQMNSMRATRYARGVTAAAFLAEYQLYEIEWELKQDGWGDNDKEFDGDFSDQGWPDMRYECFVDMVELPDYSEIQQSVDAAGTEGYDDSVQDAGEQAFDALGMVWPMVKNAIETSIRKASCTVYWTDGKIEHDFRVETFWTDPQKLTQLPQAGGEADESDDTDEDDDQPGGGGGSGPGGGGPGGGGKLGKGGRSVLPTSPGGGGGIGPGR